MFNLKFTRGLVRFASLYNASALLVFLLPGGLPFFGVPLPYSPFWLWLPSLLALFASIVLFLSSRNLEKFGAFPFWNGIIRILFAMVAITCNFQESTGVFIGIIAYGDLLVGMLCVIALPTALKKSPRQLLLNQI